MAHVCEILKWPQKIFLKVYRRLDNFLNQNLLKIRQIILKGKFRKCLDFASPILVYCIPYVWVEVWVSICLITENFVSRVWRLNIQDKFPQLLLSAFLFVYRYHFLFVYRHHLFVWIFLSFLLLWCLTKIVTLWRDVFLFCLLTQRAFVISPSVWRASPEIVSLCNRERRSK